MATSSHQWDAELYEARHSFVWQYGQELVGLLNPRKGEQILDLGCGTGQLTDQIARSGADVTGLDSSPAMIGQARQNFPSLRFLLADAAAMPFDGEFDAIFSNAALHWIRDTAAVSTSMYRALKPGGRLVFECGGRGNIQLIEQAIQQVFDDLQISLPPTRTVFHSVGSFAGILEASGFDVLSAVLFDRPTPLEGLNGMKQWLEQFAAYYFAEMPPERRPEVYQNVVDCLRPSLFRNGNWFADYRRLRVIAGKRG